MVVVENDVEELEEVRFGGQEVLGACGVGVRQWWMGVDVERKR
jgi:hypothetical protein